MFLYDVKCIDSDLHKEFVGVDNSLILENLRKLLQAKCKIWIRIPVIEEFNASNDELQKIKAFFDEYGYPEKIELLPYHAMGEHKYCALGLDILKFNAPSKEKLSKLKKIFK
jgi:pyruvate formate lyase activating enzyme